MRFLVVLGIGLLLTPSLALGQRPKAPPPITGTLKVGEVDFKKKELRLVGMLSIPVTELVPLSVVVNGKVATKYSKVTRLVFQKAPDRLKFSELKFYSTKLKQLMTEQAVRGLRPKQSVIYTTDLRDVAPQRLTLAPAGTIVILRTTK
ncbi:MAG: hypothetical protein ACFCD0_22325 [Gemmataceae bacterium]